MATYRTSGSGRYQRRHAIERERPLGGLRRACGRMAVACEPDAAAGAAGLASEGVCRDHGYVGQCYLVALVIDIADVYRQVDAADPAQHARPFGGRQVFVAPLLQRAEDHPQFGSGRGEPVGEPWPRAGFMMGLAFHHPVLHQRRQTVRQHVWGDAQPVAELRELRRAGERLAQDEERPPFAEHAEAARDRAGGVRNLLYAFILPPLGWNFLLGYARWGNLTRGERLPFRFE